MPLNYGCSLAAFRENLAKLIREGRDRAQAYAIAASTLRDACKREGKPTPEVGA